MIARLLLLIVATLLVGALAQQPPPLGSHEFEPVTIALAPEMNFPVTARVVARNYSVQTPFPGILRGIGYRLAVGKSDNAAGVAFDVVVGAMSTLFDAAIGIGYYGARLGVRTNPATGQVAVGFADAAFAMVSRFLYIAEWEDKNGNGIYDVATETIGGYDLSFGTWTPIDYGVLEQGGVPYFYAQTQTTDGVFAFRVISSGHYITSTEGTTTVRLNPTTLKISTSIRYYNNSANTPRLLVTYGPSDPIAHPNARLGLVVAFGAAAGGRAVGAVARVNAGALDFNGNTLQNVEITGGDNVGGFSWVGGAVTRDANGVFVTGGAAVAGVITSDLSIPNITQSLTNRFGAGAYAGWRLASVGVFTFQQDRPTSVVWDPSLSTTDSPAAMLVPALAVLFLAVSSLLL